MLVESRCLRCDYDLQGIADEQPCPECGLLARRSRRPSDELFNSRPRWLGKLSLGVILILLGVFIALVWQGYAIVMHGENVLPPGGAFVVYGSWKWLIAVTVGPFIGVDAMALLLLAGTWLVSAAEGFDASDRKSRRRRIALRLLGGLPLVFLLCQQALQASQLKYWINGRTGYGFRSPAVVCGATAAVFGALVVFVLFIHLKHLAGRARHAHLAEHCAVVGTLTSIVLILVACMILSVEYSQRHSRFEMWMARSDTGLLMVLGVLTFAGLSMLWSMYLMLRFAIAFQHAARELRRRWMRDDQSVSPAGAISAQPTGSRDA